MATRSRHAVLGMLTRIGTRARGSPCTANPTFHIVRHLSALRIGESKEEKLQALGADSVFGRLFDPDVFASQEIDLKIKHPRAVTFAEEIVRQKITSSKSWLHSFKRKYRKVRLNQEETSVMLHTLLSSYDGIHYMSALELVETSSVPPRADVVMEHLRMAVEMGNFALAKRIRKFLHKMGVVDTPTENQIVIDLAKKNHFDEVIKAVRDRKDEKNFPKEMFTKLLKMVNDKEELKNKAEYAMTIFREMQLFGFHPESMHCNVMLRILLTHGPLDIAAQLFKEMPAQGIPRTMETYENVLVEVCKGVWEPYAMSIFKACERELNMKEASDKLTWMLTRLGHRMRRLDLALRYTPNAKDSKIITLRYLFLAARMQNMEEVRILKKHLESQNRRYDLRIFKRVFFAFREKRLPNEIERLLTSGIPKGHEQESYFMLHRSMKRVIQDEEWIPNEMQHLAYAALAEAHQDWTGRQILEFAQYITDPRVENATKTIKAVVSKGVDLGENFITWLTKHLMRKGDKSTLHVIKTQIEKKGGRVNPEQASYILGSELYVKDQGESEGKMKRKLLQSLKQFKAYLDRTEEGWKPEILDIYVRVCEKGRFCKTAEVAYKDYISGSYEPPWNSTTEMLLRMWARAREYETILNFFSLAQIGLEKHQDAAKTFEKLNKDDSNFQHDSFLFRLLHDSVCSFLETAVEMKRKVEKAQGSYTTPNLDIIYRVINLLFNTNKSVFKNPSSPSWKLSLELLNKINRHLASFDDGSLSKCLEMILGSPSEFLSPTKRNSRRMLFWQMGLIYMKKNVVVFFTEVPLEWLPYLVYHQRVSPEKKLEHVFYSERFYHVVKGFATAKGWVSPKQSKVDDWINNSSLKLKQHVFYTLTLKCGFDPCYAGHTNYFKGENNTGLEAGFETLDTIEPDLDQPQNEIKGIAQSEAGVDMEGEGDVFKEEEVFEAASGEIEEAVEVLGEERNEGGSGMVGGSARETGTLRAKVFNSETGQFEWTEFSVDE
ncbi:hypothetical protein AAMO2058_000399000 [Amorphochlora amoebiformis]